jgi:DNA polymerase elongation subunit (family B)
VYKSDEEYIIVDADVASLYPSLAITLGLYPEHLGEEFSSIYENGIVIPRLKAKKEGDKVMADGFKLSANSVN